MNHFNMNDQDQPVYLEPHGAKINHKSEVAKRLRVQALLLCVYALPCELWDKQQNQKKRNQKTNNWLVIKTINIHSLV